MAAVLDLARRKIVGWSIGTRPTASLACQALKTALAKEKPEQGLIHHSDQGSQYTSKEYKELLKEHQIVGSMSRKGNPYDNAPMESFFRLLKVEHVKKRSFSSINQAATSIGNWMDYYNTRRRHSALGGISPLMYEIREITHLMCPRNPIRSNMDGPHLLKKIQPAAPAFTNSTT